MIFRLLGPSRQKPTAVRFACLEESSAGVPDLPSCADLSLEHAREAARMTGLSILATPQARLGDLERIERIERIVRVFGMVNKRPRHQRCRGLSSCSYDLPCRLSFVTTPA